jgi:hypothetical protein
LLKGGGWVEMGLNKNAPANWPRCRPERVREFLLRGGS